MAHRGAASPGRRERGRPTATSGEEAPLLGSGSTAAVVTGRQLEAGVLQPPPRRHSLVTRVLGVFGCMCSTMLLALAIQWHYRRSSACCLARELGGARLAVLGIGSLGAVSTTGLLVWCALWWAGTGYRLVHLPLAVALLGSVAIDMVGLEDASAFAALPDGLVFALLVALNAAALFVELLFVLHFWHEAALASKFFGCDNPPSDAWCTLVYTEFGQAAPHGAPLFKHVTARHNIVTIGTGSFAALDHAAHFSLAGLPAQSRGYPAHTDSQGRVVDGNAIVGARRRAIAPSHFKLTRDAATGNVFLALHKSTTNLPTFVGCDDATRFDPRTLEYVGPAVHEMADIELEFAGPSNDNVLRALPRARDDMGKQHRILDMRSFRHQLLTQRAAGVGQCRVAVAFSGVGTASPREDAKGEVAVRIVFHEPLRLLSSPLVRQFQVRAGSGRPRTNSYDSMKVSLSPAMRRRTGSSASQRSTVDDPTTAKLQAEVKALKRKVKEKDAQVKEGRRQLGEMGEELVKRAEMEDGLKQKLQRREAKRDKASKVVADEVERLLAEVEAYQDEMETLQGQNRQLRGALQAISHSQTPSQSPRASSLHLAASPDVSPVRADRKAKTPPPVSPRPDRKHKAPIPTPGASHSALAPPASPTTKVAGAAAAGGDGAGPELPFPMAGKPKKRKKSTKSSRQIGSPAKGAVPSQPAVD